MKIRNLFLALVLLPLGQVQAGFIVEQYNQGWSSNLNTLQNFAANNAATTTAVFDVIDFTDFNRNNDFTGFNLWPTDAADGNPNTGSTGVNDNFFVRITGTFDIAINGSYNLRTLNDDGVFLFVDGNLEINDPTLHPIARFETASLALSAGLHDLEIFMFERSGAADLEVSIREGNGGYSLLQASAVPEPSIIALFGLGLFGMGFLRRKIRK